MVNSPSKVYRQLILGGNPLWYDSSKAPPISSAAFLPSPEDTDGLSLIDTSSRSAVWAALRVEAPTTQRYVAELRWHKPQSIREGVEAARRRQSLPFPATPSCLCLAPAAYTELHFISEEPGTQSLCGSRWRCSFSMQLAKQFNEVLAVALIGYNGSVHVFNWWQLVGGNSLSIHCK